MYHMLTQTTRFIVFVSNSHEAAEEKALRPNRDWSLGKEIVLNCRLMHFPNAVFHQLTNLTAGRKYNKLEKCIFLQTDAPSFTMPSICLASV